MALTALLAQASVLQVAQADNTEAGAGRTFFSREFAPSEGIVNKTEREFRSEICLNGLWDFQPMPLPVSYVQGKGVAPELPRPTDGAWSATKIKIPSPWNVNSYTGNLADSPDMRTFPSYPKEWDDVKMGWLRRSFTVPNDWQEREIYLHFEALGGYAEVYINGKKVGESFDLFLPSDIDITREVEAGQTVELMVGIRAQRLFEDNSTVGRRIIPAGSMWGDHIAGIWQDVYLVAKPKVSIEDVFVRTLVSEKRLVAELTIVNNTSQQQSVVAKGRICEWINMAGTTVDEAPEPSWRLGNDVANIDGESLKIAASDTAKVTISTPIADGQLRYWSPEHPNLYSLLLGLYQSESANRDGRQIDAKHQRFGWREWTIDGTSYCLNGSPYPLRSDSWHFMGVPQMTRRYAYAWFSAIKAMDGNAARFHAQVYPQFYLDMADEMEICVLDESGIWASDGGPKLDSETFWNNAKKHLRRFVHRDRNHPCVMGWSVSNENKPVILYVFNRPDLIERQKEAWKDWLGIVRGEDSTRPWISSDGEEDGEGILPVTVGHYGDSNSLLAWKGIGKPWGVGEHSMAYYGTPEQVSVYNGNRAYESQQGRMEGLANECYNLIKAQRDNGASFSTVFNMVWCALKPLPFGMRDTSKLPGIDDGVYFPPFVEGKPGMQPERIGPYSSTLNPGYDPSLPLYQPWPLFYALKAANAPRRSAWSEYAATEKQPALSQATLSGKDYSQVVFVGDTTWQAYKTFSDIGIQFKQRGKANSNTLCIVDATKAITSEQQQAIEKASQREADILIWGLCPESRESIVGLLPADIKLDTLARSSFIPSPSAWTQGLGNNDFYFCELQQQDASRFTLKGDFVDMGKVMVEACPTDWRKWNKQPEISKTATTIVSELTATPNRAVVANMNNFYVCTMTDFTDSERGFNTLTRLMANAGVNLSQPTADKRFNKRDSNYTFLEMPPSSKIDDNAAEEKTPKAKSAKRKKK